MKAMISKMNNSIATIHLPMAPHFHDTVNRGKKPVNQEKYSTKHLKHFLWTTKADEKGRQVKRKARESSAESLLKKCVCEKDQRVRWKT